VLVILVLIAYPNRRQDLGTAPANGMKDVFWIPVFLVNSSIFHLEFLGIFFPVMEKKDTVVT
jgi:hypothetical protein